MGKPTVVLNQYNLYQPLQKGIVYQIRTNLCVEKDRTFQIGKGFVHIMPYAHLEVEGGIIVDGGKLSVEGSLNVCRNSTVVLRERGILSCFSSGYITVDGEIAIRGGKCFVGGSVLIRNRFSLRSGVLICNPTADIVVCNGILDVGAKALFILNSALYTRNGGVVRLPKCLQDNGNNQESKDKTIILHNTKESGFCSFLCDFSVVSQGGDIRYYHRASRSFFLCCI